MKWESPKQQEHAMRSLSLRPACAHHACTAVALLAQITGLNSSAQGAEVVARVAAAVTSGQLAALLRAEGVPNEGVVLNSLGFITGAGTGVWGGVVGCIAWLEARRRGSGSAKLVCNPLQESLRHRQVPAASLTAEAEDSARSSKFL